jgi:membrane fusion protein (multidrug efflux system)
VTATLIVIAAIAGSGCKGETTAPAGQAAAEVQVTEVVRRDVPIYSEWVGTTEGLVNAKIRAQVSGYLIKQHYTEGSFVRKGALLFELDPSKFKAALDQARGDLAKAQAVLLKAKLDVERDTPLAKQGAISQKELDDSIQTYAAAKGTVLAAQAAVEQAQLNLGWTRIIAPIDGVIGIAKAQIGDLIDANTELTSMSTLDPLRVYFPVSEQEYLKAAQKLQQAYNTPAEQQEARLSLILSDGSVYPHKGKFSVADRQVDVKTGTIRIAALFPNPGNLLRPGQYARVRAVTRTREGALLVPQRAVSELQGSHQVAVVKPDSTVEIRPVKVAERVGSMWIITEGIQPGERVVVEGLQKLKAGMAVTPKPYLDSSEDQQS